MRPSQLFRPQAIVVILVALVVLSRGDAHWLSPSEPGTLIALGATPTSQNTYTIPKSPVATNPPTLVPASQTSMPPTLAPTQPPTSSPQPPPTAAPTSTSEANERPVAPPTGIEGESLIIERAETGRMEMAITFDAGDGRGYTLEILDVLDQYGVKASFGVTGAWAEANPDLLLEIVERGHHVMNHTYTHRSFTGASPGTEPLSAEERRAEVTDTEETIRKISGYDVAPYFRFPYGDYDRADLAMLKELGYDYTMWWTCDSLAWMGTTPEEIVERCGVEEAAPGAIILLHVDPEADFQALPGLIETLQGDGYRLVTLEWLIQP